MATRNLQYVPEEDSGELRASEGEPEDQSAAAKRPSPERNALPTGSPEPEAPWDSLATIALGDDAGTPRRGARVAKWLKQPTVYLALAVAALAYPAYRGVMASRHEGPNFPGKYAGVFQETSGESVTLHPGEDSARAPEVSIHDDQPMLEVILVGPKDVDPARPWKVLVTHPGREIWKSKWPRSFERVKDEWQLGFELDGRDLPEGPLTVVIEETGGAGSAAADSRVVYRVRIKRRG